MRPCLLLLRLPILHCSYQNRDRPACQRRCSFSCGKTRPLKAPDAWRKSQDPDDRPSYWSGAFSHVQLRPLLTATQTSSGLLADGRHITNRARDEAANYRDNYHEPAPLKVFYSCAVSNCPHLTTSCPGVVRPSKPLRTGIYPLLFRTAIRL